VNTPVDSRVVKEVEGVALDGHSAVIRGRLVYRSLGNAVIAQAIVAHHGDPVLPAKTDQGRDLRLEGKVTEGVAGGVPAVDPNHSRVVDATEAQPGALVPLPGAGHEEGPFVPDGANVVPQVVRGDVII